jgi:hypothetical protein
MQAFRIAIIIAIAILLPATIFSGARIFLQEPRYNDYPREFGPNITAEQKTKNDEATARLEADRQTYALRLILITSPFGLAAILFGLFLQEKTIAAGLILGGVFNFLFHDILVWDSLYYSVRFVSLVVPLGLLLWLALRRLKAIPQP